MEENMTQEEQEIMRNAFIFLKTHCNPPFNTADTAHTWWLQTVQEMVAVCNAWNNHPLAIAVFLALYDYIEDKANKKTEGSKDV